MSVSAVKVIDVDVIASAEGTPNKPLLRITSSLVSKSFRIINWI